jgi:hypothetical protein
MKMNRKNGPFNLSKESWWKSRGSLPGSQKGCKILALDIHSLKKYEELITTPDLPQLASDTHLNDLQKQGFAANQERKSYWPYDIKIRGKVNYDVQPTNPQADIVATGRCKYYIADVDLIKHQGNITESPSDDPILPEVYTATVACIYNVDGKCKACSPLSILTIYKELFNRKTQRPAWKHLPNLHESCIRARGLHYTQGCRYLRKLKIHALLDQMRLQTKRGL